MKTHLLLLLFLLLTGMYSCSSDDGDRAYSLEVLPHDEVRIDPDGGTVILSVNTNAPIWQYDCDVNWIIISKDLTNKQLILEVEKNYLKEEKVATLKFAVEGAEREVVVKQAAADMSSRIELPFHNFSTIVSSDVITAFELSRNHKFSYREESGDLSFSSESKYTHTFLYSFDYIGGCRMSKVIVNDLDQLIDSDLLKKVIADEGFKLQYSERQVEGGDVYWSEEKSSRMHVSSRSDKPEIQFEEFDSEPQHPVMDENYQTFEELPYPKCLDFGATVNEVIAQEGRNPDLSLLHLNQLVYTLDGEASLTYFFDDEKRLMQALYMNPEMEYIGYFSPLNGLFYLSKNFQKLMKDSGYVFLNYNNEFHGYSHKEKALELRVGALYDNDNYMYKMAIYYFPYK